MILLRSPALEGKPPLIDFTHPDQSLLIQYARPRIDAKFPHPDIPGWKPVLISGRESLMNDALLWIRGMHQPRSDYPIDYTPPRLGNSRKNEADSGPDR